MLCAFLCCGDLFFEKLATDTYKAFLLCNMKCDIHCLMKTTLSQTWHVKTIYIIEKLEVSSNMQSKVQIL